MKTKKLIVALFALGMLSTSIYAQQPHHPKEKKENINAMKVGFFTQQMNLTSAEAEAFWPVYNRYEEELHGLREQFKEQTKEVRENQDEMSDKDIEKMVDQKIINDQIELDLKKKYHAEFKKVLPIKKVAQLYRAEDQFKRELLKKIKTRDPQKQGDGGPHKPHLEH